MIGALADELRGLGLAVEWTIEVLCTESAAVPMSSAPDFRPTGMDSVRTAAR